MITESFKMFFEFSSSCHISLDSYSASSSARNIFRSIKNSNCFRASFSISRCSRLVSGFLFFGSPWFIVGGLSLLFEFVVIKDEFDAAAVCILVEGCTEVLSDP